MPTATFSLRLNVISDGYYYGGDNTDLPFYKPKQIDNYEKRQGSNCYKEHSEKMNETIKIVGGILI